MGGGEFAAFSLPLPVGLGPGEARPSPATFRLAAVRFLAVPCDLKPPVWSVGGRLSSESCVPRCRTTVGRTRRGSIIIRPRAQSERSPLARVPFPGSAPCTQLLTRGYWTGHAAHRHDRVGAWPRPRARV